MGDTNVLIEDGAIELKFGAAKVEVKALTIEASVQWTKRVRRAWLNQALKNGAMVDVATAKETKAEERMQAFDDALAAGAGDDLMAVMSLLTEHSPAVLTPETLKQATARQIESAFEAIYSLENPMKALREFMKTA